MKQIGTITEQFYRVNSKPTNNSIELPDEIDGLIDNKMYRNKFKKLVREGHLKDLMALAEIAQSKTKPSCWFAKVCAKARWEATLKWLHKVREVTRRAEEVIKRLKVPAEHFKAVYKAAWKRSDVVRLAVTAAETGRDSFKYFCWLCSRT